MQSSDFDSWETLEKELEIEYRPTGFNNRFSITRKLRQRGKISTPIKVEVNIQKRKQSNFDKEIATTLRENREFGIEKKRVHLNSQANIFQVMDAVLEEGTALASAPSSLPLPNKYHSSNNVLSNSISDVPSSGGNKDILGYSNDTALIPPKTQVSEKQSRNHQKEVLSAMKDINTWEALEEELGIKYRATGFNSRNLIPLKLRQSGKISTPVVIKLPAHIQRKRKLKSLEETVDRSLESLPPQPDGKQIDQESSSNTMKESQLFQGEEAPLDPSFLQEEHKCSDKVPSSTSQVQPTLNLLESSQTPDPAEQLEYIQNESAVSEESENAKVNNNNHKSFNQSESGSNSLAESNGCASLKTKSLKRNSRSSAVASLSLKNSVMNVKKFLSLNFQMPHFPTNSKQIFFEEPMEENSCRKVDVHAMGPPSTNAKSLKEIYGKGSQYSYTPSHLNQIAEHFSQWRHDLEMRGNALT